MIERVAAFVRTPHLRLRHRVFVILFFIPLSMIVQSCWNNSCHTEMISILQKVSQQNRAPENQFEPEAKMVYMDSLLRLEHSTPSQVKFCNFLKSRILLEVGEEGLAIELLEKLIAQQTNFDVNLERSLALAHLRNAERTNCISDHASMSCILPIRGIGIHRDISGSSNAIKIYERILSREPGDLESKWLLNLAYQTIGKYPGDVPKEFFIPGMDGDTTIKVKRFEDIASGLGVDVNSRAGGVIIEDFDNDGYLDIMISAMGTTDRMHYFRNKADGTFEDASVRAQLTGINGGLNIQQTDYNNDGFKDVFVLRGAWKREFGREPNSLLRNNGDGTFTDVTTISGLLSFHPTQTATWNDFNNDGWLDVFIGNESVISGLNETHRCELYMNKGDGTFVEVAANAWVSVAAYVKAVTSGDYDNDGWADLFISTMDGARILLRNMGKKEVRFENVTVKAGIANEKSRTFPTWFWDYNNDGWLDIFVCDYTFTKSLAYHSAAEKLNIPDGNMEKMLLFRNNRNGTFTNVAHESGLNTNVFAMGANFGDIDNDGFLDMYLGSGNPAYESLVPNKMFKNIDGNHFADVTTSAGVGHLQKGHGIAFADVDNDGDQDIYEEMGGAYPGDAYQNSFYLNPGQNDNHWIGLQLEGVKSNRAAIGSRVKISITENGQQRNIYRDVNSGGSFGSSPLRREIGLGQAVQIDSLQITWHGSGTTQVFRNIPANQFIRIKEGQSVIEKTSLRKLDWILPNVLCLPDPIVIN